MSMINKKRLLVLIMVAIFTIPPTVTFASNITSPSNAWSESVGWFKFDSETGNIKVKDEGLTGSAYNDNTGWLVLDGVSNNGQGKLSGYAWSESVGYFDFSKVTIENNHFRGYAYNDNIGFLSFNCSNTGTCGDTDYKVSTHWEPTRQGSTRSKSSPERPSNVCEDPQANNYNDAESCTYDEIKKQCIQFNQYHKIGDTGGDVQRIQSFLNDVIDSNLQTNGVFDEQTKIAVKEFQSGYLEKVLIPWKLDGPTGWWYQSTRKKANELIGCPEGEVLLDNGVLLDY